MSFDFKCSPMYNNHNNKVIGYMCNSDETTVEGFETSPKKNSSNSTSDVDQILSTLNNYKLILSSIKTDIAKFINNNSLPTPNTNSSKTNSRSSSPSVYSKSEHSHIK